MLDLDRPRDRDTHTLADFIEILCLITIDRTCSRDYTRDYIVDTTDKDHKPSDNQIEDAFSQLQWRLNAFGSAYPFKLDDHFRPLIAEEGLSHEQELYVFLLLCANLAFISRDNFKTLTDAFERMSLAALRRMWPKSARIRSFGKNETDYAGRKWERLNQLGKNIGGQPCCTEETYRSRDTGDGGIDLVAWLPLDEHEGWNIPSALGQCACSRNEWSRKQSEISNQRLGRHLRPSHPWMELIFIPHCFRDNRGRWAIDGDIGQTVVLDRLRILSNLEAEEDMVKLNLPDALNLFLEMRLDIV